MKKKIGELTTKQVIHYCYNPEMNCSICPLNIGNNLFDDCVRTLMEDGKDISKYKDIEIEVEEDE